MLLLFVSDVRLSTFHKCIAYVGGALRLAGGEMVKIDIGWQSGRSRICGRVLPKFAQGTPVVSERDEGNLCPTQRFAHFQHDHMLNGQHLFLISVRFDLCICI